MHRYLVQNGKTDSSPLSPTNPAASIAVTSVEIEIVAATPTMLVFQQQPLIVSTVTLLLIQISLRRITLFFQFAKK
jgi:hypothetical protein